MTWRSDLVAAPFSAHPLLERDGSAWNFGSLDFFGATALIIWRIGADGALVRTAVLESREPGYLHSFAMTEKYLVFMFMPYRMDAGDGSFFERMRFAARSRLPHRAGAQGRARRAALVRGAFAAIYHFGDAYEHRGEVVVRAARHMDIEEARSPMAAAMRGERGAQGTPTELVSLRLDLARNRARWETHGVSGFEFPTFDERTPGDEPALLFAPTHRGRGDRAVLQCDLEHRHARRSHPRASLRRRCHGRRASVRAAAGIEHARRRVVSRDAARLQARPQRRGGARCAARGQRPLAIAWVPTPCRWASTGGSRKWGHSSFPSKRGRTSGLGVRRNEVACFRRSRGHRANRSLRPRSGNGCARHRASPFARKRGMSPFTARRSCTRTRCASHRATTTAR